MSAHLRNGLYLILILAVLGFGFCIFWRYYGVPQQWMDPSLRGRTAQEIYEKLGKPSASALVKGFDEWHMDGFPYWGLIIIYSEIKPMPNRLDQKLDPNNFRAESAQLLRLNNIYVVKILESHDMW